MQHFDKGCQHVACLFFSSRVSCNILARVVRMLVFDSLLRWISYNIVTRVVSMLLFFMTFFVFPVRCPGVTRPRWGGFPGGLQGFLSSGLSFLPC